MNLYLPLYFAPPWHCYIGIPESACVVINCGGKYDEDPLRYRIDIASDKGRQSISIPLIKDSRKGKLSELRISYAEHWQKKMINALRTCYGKSPFYAYYDYMIEPIINHKYEFLIDLNMDMQKFIFRSLNLPLNHVHFELSDFPYQDKTTKSPDPLRQYYQTFADKTGFISGLSILDLIFNEGPEALFLLKQT